MHDSVEKTATIKSPFLHIHQGVLLIWTYRRNLSALEYIDILFEGMFWHISVMHYLKWRIFGVFNSNVLAFNLPKKYNLINISFRPLLYLRIIIILNSMGLDLRGISYVSRFIFHVKSWCIKKQCTCIAFFYIQNQLQ